MILMYNRFDGQTTKLPVSWCNSGECFHSNEAITLQCWMNGKPITDEALSPGNVSNRVISYLILQQSMRCCYRNIPPPLPLLCQLTGSFVACSVQSIIYSKLIDVKISLKKFYSSSQTTSVKIWCVVNLLMKIITINIVTDYLALKVCEHEN